MLNLHSHDTESSSCRYPEQPAAAATRGPNSWFSAPLVELGSLMAPKPAPHLSQGVPILQSRSIRRNWDPLRQFPEESLTRHVLQNNSPTCPQWLTYRAASLLRTLVPVRTSGETPAATARCRTLSRSDSNCRCVKFKPISIIYTPSSQPTSGPPREHFYGEYFGSVMEPKYSR